MASIGSVVSTAITGGDSPVFVGVPKDITALSKQTSATSAGVAEVNAKVDALADLFTKFLEAQAIKDAPTNAEEPAPKAPAKAKAKADATKDTDTPTKDPEGKLDPADEKVGSVQKGQ